MRFFLPSLVDFLNLITTRYKTNSIAKASLLKQPVRTTKKGNKKLENASVPETKIEKPPTASKTRKKTTAKEKANSKDGTNKPSKIKSTTSNVAKKENADKSKTLTSSLNNTVDRVEHQHEFSDVGVEEMLADDNNGEASLTADEYIVSEDVKDSDSDREFAVGRVGMKYREGTIGARLYEVSTLAEINGYLSLGQVSCTMLCLRGEKHLPGHICFCFFVKHA